MNEKDAEIYITIPKHEYERLKFAEDKILEGREYFIWEGCGSVAKIYSITENVMFEKLAKENDKLQQEYLKIKIKLWEEMEKSLWKRIFKIPA